MKGMLVAEKDIKGRLIFDSRNVRPQIAIDRDPKHLDIIDHSPGTALVAYNDHSVGPYYAEETLYSIKHNLGYVPRVLVYFYVKSTNGYAIGKYFYGFGNIDDKLDVRVDANTFSIIHTLENFSDSIGDPGFYTSQAPSFGIIRTKYMIFSNPVDKPTDSA